MSLDSSASHGGFLPVRYIGKRPEYTDGAYGTHIHWLRGDSRMVPADKARLLLKHKDVYEPGEVSGELPAVTVKPTEEDDTLETRDAIANMGKDGLAEFAKTNFNVTIEKRKGLPALREQVTGLVDQFGIA